MKRFHSTARRDGRWWFVQCVEEPGAISQVARLDQIEEHQREAISMVTDIPEREILIEVKVELPLGLDDLLAQALEDRRRADELATQASEQVRKVAHLLVEEGYSMRDAGSVLGVSHQRVAQLVNH